MKLQYGFVGYKVKIKCQNLSNSVILLLKKNANGHGINLVTWDNLADYILLPEIIKKRHKEGNISLTHISDVIRMTLLSKYGGIWIDSTYWITQPLEINGLELYTIKQHFKHNGANISDYRWTTHFFAVAQPYYVFDFCLKCMIKHFTLHKRIVHYLLFDYILNIAYNNFEDFRNCINSQPIDRTPLYIMQELFTKEFDPKKYNELLNETPKFKLNRKGKYMDFIQNKPTYYNYFINMDL